jgi:glycosyltransferase involved in cell wall biosynthesis
MFSVIIPLYNKERHVQKTIDTVLNQTFDEFEIVVIDDGSTDKSLDIVRNIECDKLRVYSQKNRGVSVARNNGAKKANYDYLLFLDADDGLMPAYLFGISKLITEYPQAGIYSTNYYNYKSRFDALIERPVPFLPEKGIVDNYFELILEKGAILASVSVITRNAFNKAGGYPEGMVNGEDTFFLSKILLTEKLCFLNEPLYFCTYDSDNRASAIYRPADTDVSLLDYLGTGVYKADEYIICYSLGQVKKLIRSGYTDEAMKHLELIRRYTPKHFFECIEKKAEEIKMLKNLPYWRHKGKRVTLNYLVYFKDILKYKLKIPIDGFW